MVKGRKDWIILLVATALALAAGSYFFARGRTDGPAEVAKRYVEATAGDLAVLRETTHKDAASVPDVIRAVYGVQRRRPVVVTQVHDGEGTTPDDHVVTVRGTAGGRVFSTRVTLYRDGDTGSWRVGSEQETN